MEHEYCIKLTNRPTSGAKKWLAVVCIHTMHSLMLGFGANKIRHVIALDFRSEKRGSGD